MKKKLLLSIFMLTLFHGFSQTKGISYQAVILNPEPQQLPGVDSQGNILVNTTVGIEFTITDGSGNEEYKENHTTSTDAYGMINLLIGTGNIISYNSFSDIVWDGITKKLKVAIDFSGGTNYSALSEQGLTFMPQPASDETGQLISDNTSEIAEEIIRSTAAEVTLQTNIDTEATAVRAAELANATAITTESTRATAAETTLQTNIDTEVTAARATELANAIAISDEIIRATTAETTLQTNIDTEATTARAAELLNANAIATGTTNAAAIATNVTDIATNTATGTANAAAIATNATDIAINTAKVSSKFVDGTTATNAVFNGGSVGIGVAEPNTSAVLEISSTTQGVLVSRMTSVQRDAIANSANGLLIFNTSNNTFEVYKASCSCWVAISDGGNTEASSLVNTSNKLYTI
jgi:hypothetical protein